MRQFLYMLLGVTTLLLIGFSPARAQGRYVVGMVFDQANQVGVNQVTVTNKRTLQRVRTNTAGRFFITALPGDSLIATSQTHARAGIRWDGSDKPVITVNKLPYTIDRSYDLAEVTVKAKRYEEVKREIQQLLAEPVASRTVTGEQAFDRLADGAGVTLLYEMFSKEAKGRRKAAVLAQEYRRQKLANERMRLLVDQATDLKGSEVDQFIDFCDFVDDDVLQATDYDLIRAIQTRHKLFRSGRRSLRISPDPQQK
ncbi:hypothetical protein [Rudanella lutea]|uniref:hypothetical protein n=1 Tax=Rudanella lutea TaxID=451374 RepID=UPI00047F01B9|nr:hypothetical protein [Rudanella lutea]